MNIDLYKFPQKLQGAIDMQRILLALGQALRKSVVILCVMSLISVSSLFIFVAQPSYAATAFDKKPAQSSVAPSSTDTVGREKAYEEAVKDAESIDSIEKVYEENLEEYKEENPDPGLVEKAENLIEKVTGND